MVVEKFSVFSHGLFSLSAGSSNEMGLGMPDFDFRGVLRTSRGGKSFRPSVDPSDTIYGRWQG
jgi:hypothetical protein